MAAPSRPVGPSLAVAVLAGAAAGVADAVHVALAGRMGLGLPGLIALVGPDAAVGALGAVALTALALPWGPWRRAGAAGHAITGAAGAVLGLAGPAVAVGWGPWIAVGAALAGLVLPVLLARAGPWPARGLVAVFAVGAVAWASHDRPLPVEPVRATAHQPSVLVITVEGWRRDRVSGARIDTPASRRLAQEGASFTAATGTGASAAAQALDLLAAVGPGGAVEGPTLARALAAQGYRTGAFLAAPIEGVHGAPWHVVDDATDWPLGIARTGAGRWVGWLGGDLRARPRRAERVIDRALRFVASSEGAWLAWVHLTDPAPPYAAPPPYDARHVGDLSPAEGDGPVLREQSTLDPRHDGALDDVRSVRWVVGHYDGEVATIEAQVARMLGALDTSGASGSTLVVLASASGQNLADADVWFGEGHTLGPHLLDLPVFLRLPGRVTAGSSTAEPVTLGDVGATVFDLVGRPVPDAGAYVLRGALEGGPGPRAHVPAVRDRAVAVRVPGALVGWSPARGYQAWVMPDHSGRIWTPERVREALDALPDSERPPASIEDSIRLLTTLGRTRETTGGAVPTP